MYVSTTWLCSGFTLKLTLPINSPLMANHKSWRQSQWKLPFLKKFTLKLDNKNRQIYLNFLKMDSKMSYIYELLLLLILIHWINKWFVRTCVWNKKDRISKNWISQHILVCLCISKLLLWQLKKSSLAGPYFRKYFCCNKIPRLRYF